MKNFITYIFVLLVISGLGVAGYFYVQYQNFLTQPVFDTEKITFEIKKGSSYGDFIQTVKSNNGYGSVFNWKLLAKLNHYENSIKAGEFEISQPLTPKQLVRYIADNKVKTYSVTLVEGHNWSQIKQQLIDSPIANSLLDLGDEQLVYELGIKAGHLEGQFLPETYQYTKGDQDLAILYRAHQALQVALSQSWAGRDNELLLKTPYELLILASIIEKETAENSERNIVSGVFHRRLQKNMRLQTDPTVI